MSLSKSLAATVSNLRSKVEAARSSGIARNYPPGLRSEVTTCLGTMRAEGVAWEQCKEALGICKATLYSWHREASASSESTAMVPVKLRNDKAATTSGGLRLITPGGHQLVGLDLNQAAQLLRALG